ncbi:hypothetical protein HGB13_00565 [bacterium]|nr:hypothetical protein [bacterium]
MFNKKLKERVDKISSGSNLNFSRIERELRNNRFEIAKTRELYERLGQKRKEDKEAIQIIFISLFKFLGVKLDENDEIVKVTKTKNAKLKTLSPSVKTNKRKSR